MLAKMPIFEKSYLMKGQRYQAFFIMCYCYFRTYPEKKTGCYLFFFLNYNNLNAETFQKSSFSTAITQKGIVVFICDVVKKNLYIPSIICKSFSILPSGLISWLSKMLIFENVSHLNCQNSDKGKEITAGHDLHEFGGY